MPPSCEEKLNRLREEIADRRRLLIAYSGGVDSGLLLKVACDVLERENVLAVTFDSEVVPRSELIFAREFASYLNAQHKIVKFSWLERKRLVENSPNRCFFCKLALSRILKDIAAEHGFDVIADGATLSDVKRPGMRASSIWHPFVDVKITKDEVREIARMLNMPFWDKPPMSCLATRVQYGMRISSDLLRKIEHAEAFIRGKGFSQVRVRIHDMSHASGSTLNSSTVGRADRNGSTKAAGENTTALLARIEIDREDLCKFDMKIACEVCEELKSLGFLFVTLDLEGYRSGSMDAPLDKLQTPQQRIKQGRTASDARNG